MMQSQAVAEWRDEGRVDALGGAILDFLTTRFGAVSPELAVEIRDTTALAKLREWVKLSAKVGSVSV